MTALAPVIGQQVSLTWNVPDPTNGVITGYRVCYLQVQYNGSAVKASKETCMNISTVNYILMNLGK